MICRSVLSAFSAFVALTAPAAVAPAPMSAWQANPMEWKVASGSVTALGARGTAFCGSEAYGEAVFSAEVTPGETTGTFWHTLGIGLLEDDDNYWNVSLVQAPEASGAKTMCELNEMRGGDWGAWSHDRLRCVRTRGDGKWTKGATYRLTIALSADGVEASVADVATGRLVFDKRIAFAAADTAVRTGAPALFTKGGFAGRFTAFELAVDPATRRAKTAYPPFFSVNPIAGVSGRKTGFFHMEKTSDGRWWAIDPLGCGTFLRGVDHVRYRGHSCERLNGRTLYGETNRRKYAGVAAWEKATLARLTDWGFNVLGVGCQQTLWRRGFPHALSLGFGQAMTKNADEDWWIGPDTSCPRLNFPNVFHPDFETYCEAKAQAQCAKYRDDPWLLGYFLDNELSWRQGGGEDGLFNKVMSKKSGHSAKAALRDFLKARVKGDLAAFNALWGTALADFDGILSLTSLPGGTPARAAAKRDFMALAAERYFAVSRRAILKADPNHMVLGARFSGVNDECVWAAAGRHCDLLSVNCYPWADLDRNVILRHRGRDAKKVSDLFGDYYLWGGKPLYVTEWSFPSFESDVPCTVGAGERFHTQRERAEATALYAKTMLALPHVAGYNYFMWVDEPPLGISIRFPEDSNYGLVNTEDVPYAAVTKTFADLHGDLAAWRRSALPAERVLKPAPPLTAPRVAANVRAKTAAAAAARPVVFTRTGKDYVVENAVGLKVSGRVGGGFPMPVLEKVTLNGKDMGSLGAVLVILPPNGRGQFWQYTGNVTSAEWVADATGGGALTVTCRGGYGKKGAASNTPYEATFVYRFFPDRPWILASVERIRNLGGRDYVARLVSFRQMAPFQHDLRPGKGFRPAWREADKDRWIEMDTGAYAGALSYAPDLLRISYQATVLKGDVPAHLANGDKARPFSNPMTALARGGAREWTIPRGGEVAFDGAAWILCVYGAAGGDPAWRQATWAAEAVIGRGAAAGATTMGW